MLVSSFPPLILVYLIVNLFRPLVSCSLVPFLPQFLFISLSIFFVRSFRARCFPSSLNSCLSHCQFLSSARFVLVSSLPPSILVYLIVNFYRPLVSCSLVPFLPQFLFISLLIFFVRSFRTRYFPSSLNSCLSHCQFFFVRSFRAR